MFKYAVEQFPAGTSDYMYTGLKSHYKNIKYTHFKRTIFQILLYVQQYGFNVCLKCSPDVNNSIEHVMFQCQHKNSGNCTEII